MKITLIGDQPTAILHTGLAGILINPVKYYSRYKDVTCIIITKKDVRILEFLKDNANRFRENTPIYLEQTVWDFVISRYGSLCLKRFVEKIIQPNVTFSCDCSVKPYRVFHGNDKCLGLDFGTEFSFIDGSFLKNKEPDLSSFNFFYFNYNFGISKIKTFRYTGFLKYNTKSCRLLYEKGFQLMKEDKTMDEKKFFYTCQIAKSGTDGRGFYIEGYAATSDLDRQNDIITTGALKAAGEGLLSNDGRTVFFNHNYDRCVGRLDSADVDNTGLLVKIYISEVEQELRTKISEGVISKFSIGGRILSSKIVSRTEAERITGKANTNSSGKVNLITGIELFEVSVVGLPANAKAGFRVHKSLEEAVKEMLEPTLNTTEAIDKEDINVEKIEGAPEVIETPVDAEKNIVIETHTDIIDKTEIAPDGVVAQTDGTVTQTRIDTDTGEKATAIQEVHDKYVYTEEQVQKIKAEAEKAIESQKAEIDALKKKTEELEAQKLTPTAEIKGLADYVEAENVKLHEKIDALIKTVNELNAKVKEIPVEADVTKTAPIVVVEKKLNNKPIEKSVDEIFLEKIQGKS